MIDWIAISWYEGVIGLWHLLLCIPHPSWHRLTEAFITGLIIKGGYYTGHKLVALDTKKRPKDVGLTAGISEYIEH